MSSSVQRNKQRLGPPNASKLGSASVDAAPPIEGVPDSGRLATVLTSDLICYALLALAILIIFWKTVFLGQTISRFPLIAEWDSLFDSVRRGVSMKIDPSAVLMFVPTYTYIASQLHAGHLPLWNPLNSFGSPLVGDIQSLLFSPFHLFFNLCPSQNAYSIQMVGQVWLAAATMFGLTRKVGIGKIPALFAALTYSLCPYVLWYQELWGAGCALAPLLATLFLSAADCASLRSAVYAGIGCGALILSGHPEHSFFMIFAASLLLLFVRGVSFRTKGKNEHSSWALITLAGMSALCVSAPVLLPFLEFLKNSDCYKFAVTEPTIVPWQSLAFNLFVPGFGAASPYLGCLVPLFLACSAFCLNNRGVRAIALLCAVFIWVSAELFPLNLLAKNAPFIYIQTTYALPVLLMSVAVLAAAGLERLGSLVFENRRALWLICGVLAAILILPKLLVSHVDLSRGNFDMTLPSMYWNDGAWKTACTCSLVALGAIVASSFRANFRISLPFVLAVASLFSLSPLSRHSLRETKPIALPKLQCVEYLRNHGDRVVAVGNHLCKPNINMVLGLDDARSINPMFPKRYINFMKACGVDSSEYSILFGNELRPPLDVASVKYVLTQEPLESNRFRLVGRYPNAVSIYENSDALPRAYIVPNAVHAADESDALKLIESASFDAHKSVVLEDSQPPASGVVERGSTDWAWPSPYKVGADRSDPNCTKLTTDSKEAGYLVCTDTFYPGWNAYLDGKRTPILRANYLFRAIELPAGHHAVAFRYEPSSFALGVFLSTAFWFSFAGLTLLALIRTRPIYSVEVAEAGAA